MESAYAKSIAHPLHFVKRIRKISRAIRLWQFPQTFFPLLKTVFQRGVFPQCCGKLWKTTVLGYISPKIRNFPPFPTRYRLFRADFSPHPVENTFGKLPLSPIPLLFPHRFSTAWGKLPTIPWGNPRIFPHMALLGKMYDPAGFRQVFFLSNLLKSSCNPGVFVIYYMQHIKGYVNDYV